MAAVSTFVAVAGLAIAAKGAKDQRSAAKESAAIERRQADSMEEAAVLEKHRSDIANQRALRASLRQARLARSDVVNMAALTGTSGSSGELGGLASIGTQAGVNRGVFVQGQDLAEKTYQVSTEMSQLYAARGSAAARGTRGQLASSIGSTLFGIGGGYKTLFGA
jgi:hypothetical protein